MATDKCISAPVPWAVLILLKCMKIFKAFVTDASVATQETATEDVAVQEIATEDMAVQEIATEDLTVQQMVEPVMEQMNTDADVITTADGTCSSPDTPDENSEISEWLMSYYDRQDQIA